MSTDLKAANLGIVTLELIKPVAGGTAFYVQKEIENRGKLISASIYPDSGASNEITPATLFVGRGDFIAHEGLTSAENDERLERMGLTPNASARSSANIYDIVFAQTDALQRAVDLASWGTSKIKVEAAASMSGTCDILLARLEAK